MAISPAPPTVPRFATSALTILVLSAGTIVVWLHNRDILRDLFDYSTVIVAAGKIEAGLKPYTGVRTPMQSSVYLLNYLTEQIFGRSYLALTWGGLVQALGGGLLLRALVVRRLGSIGATVVALAVVLAGLLQHMVFFYNPVGILCFGAVLFGLAVEPALWPVRSWRPGAVLGALFLCGLNKLNFQGATLLLAGMLSVTAWTSGRIPFAAVVRNALLVGLFGAVLPLAFELAWSGASPALWFENVVLLPTARHAYVREAAGWGMYLRPAFDFHHHLLIRPIGGLGLGLLLAAGGWLLRDARVRRRPAADWIARLLLIGSGCAVGALLMITNHETAMLTSLAYPITAVAVYLNFPAAAEVVAARWAGRGIVGLNLLWVVAGAYAAWHGSRLLYGLNPPPRSDYVKLHSSSRALAYFDGVRMLPAQIDACERLAAKLRTMEDSGGKLSGVLFGPGLEWLERAYPEAIVNGSPIWYHAGTTLHERDADYFKALLDGGRRRLAVQHGWESWPGSIQQLLARDYRAERVSGRDVMYHPRDLRGPVVAAPAPGILPPDVFRDAIEGNVLIASTRYSEEMAIHSGPGGRAFGAARDTNWSWPLGTYDAAGKLVARLQPDAAVAGVVTFRAIAGDPVDGELLWETPVALGPDRREVILPVVLQPGGRPVWLQTKVPADGSGKFFGGWREMRITHTNGQDRSPPPPFGRALQRIWPEATEPVADQIWFARAGQPLTGDGWATLPAEDWRRDTMQSGKLSVTAEFEPDPANPGDHLVMTLAWYRGSRFEIMTEKEIDPRTTPRLTLDAYVPEAGGWVGVLVRTGTAQHRVHVLTWGR